MAVGTAVWRESGLVAGLRDLVVVVMTLLRNSGWTRTESDAGSG